MKKILNYIDGKFCEPINNQYLDNINPATGSVYSLVANSDEKDLEIAVQSALNAFNDWSKTSASFRAELLLKLAEKIKQNLENFALAECIDNGKPLSLCKNIDIPRASLNFKYFAETLMNFHGSSYVTDLISGNKALNYTTYHPIGVVACISPWNLPLYSLTWKIAPALAAGNCVIAKPSEITPMTSFLLAELLEEVGFPKGVLNILQGSGTNVGNAIVAHEKVKAISFTGSTSTGRHINKIAASFFKKVSLEMGGKNANIIFSDADFEKAIKTTIRSSFLNQGQICLCGSRIFIQKNIYEKFKDALVHETKKLKINNPLVDGTDQGAIVSLSQLEKVMTYISLAEKEGGKIIYGGKRFKLDGENSNGYFIEPTLIENLPYTCKTNQEEIFGPVATLIPFETEEEVLHMANATKYGLSASIWTNDLTRAHNFAARLDNGIVWINTWMLRDLRTPFGGVKESGIGREGGTEAFAFFSEIKNICIEL